MPGGCGAGDQQEDDEDRPTRSRAAVAVPPPTPRGASTPEDLLAFELDVFALGAAGDGSPTTHLFRYGADEVVEVSGFGSVRPLAGALRLEDRASEGGEVVLSGLRLDFAQGIAEGFCFTAAEDSPSCIRGGGTSSNVEAELRVSPILLPASLPLAAAALGLLGLQRAGRARAAAPRRVG